MNKILELRQKRAEAWDKARAFLDEHTSENGVMSAEDSQQYERMEQEVVDLGHTIDRMERAEQMDREMNERVSPNLASRPMRTQETLRGIASAEYRNAFWKHMRDIDRRSPEVRNALQVGTLSEGGYTVPDEFEHQLIQGLEEENIMRGLVHKITTSSGDRKIPLVTARGSASWIEEEAAIPESDDTFGQVTLGAHKVGCMIRVSEELLHDSAFDLAAYIAGEFARRVGAAEEEAILTGSGTHKYKEISLVYFVLVLFASFLFPVVNPTAALGKVEFFCLVLVIGLYGALDFYTMAKYRVLLTADRKEYVISNAMILI